MLSYDYNYNLYKSIVKTFLLLLIILSTASAADNSLYDINGNAIIDAGDLVIIRQHFNEITNAPYPSYDVNMDGVVDETDANIVGEHLGETVESQASSGEIQENSKYDLNDNGMSADAGDFVLMKRTSTGEIEANSRYDLNDNGMPADAGDLVLMRRASIGETVEAQVTSQIPGDNGLNIDFPNDENDEESSTDTTEISLSPSQDFVEEPIIEVPSPTPSSMQTPVPTLSSLMISSNDGLKLNLNGNGNIAGLNIDGTDLPILPVQGGFSFREVLTDAPNLLANPGFENGMDMPLNWKFDVTDGNTPAWDTISHSGSRSIKISIPDGMNGISGNARSDLVKSEPLTYYTLSAWGKTEDVTANSVRIAELDINKNVLRQTKLGFDSGTYDWMQKQITFRTGEGTSYLYVYANIWNGHGTLWIDDIQISQFFGPSIYLDGTLTQNPDGTITQTANAQDIDFTFHYIPKGRYIELKGEVQDRRGTDRMIQVMYNLPLNANGWRWGDYISGSRIINESAHFENTYNIGETRTQSKYPFASIDNNIQGLSIAVPMDVPRIYRKGYDLINGYSIQYDFGLSDKTHRIGPGFANFTFIMFKADEPEWGFRSIVKKYYELYPRFFEKKVDREGGWAVSTDLSSIANIADFGFLFDESQTNTVFNTENNIYNLLYIEPWGWWKSYGDKPNKPSYSERINDLNNDLNSNADWKYGIPVKDIANSVVNSAIISDEENYYIDARPSYWSKWGNSWMQFYPTNPDPKIPLPNRFEINIREYQKNTDGIFFDGPGLDATFENYNKKHWNYVDIPLVFGYKSKKPTLLNMFSEYEYLDNMNKYLNKDNKFSAMNTFPYTYTLFASLIDVLGNEIGDIETAEISSYRRTMSYKKTNSNLMQWKWGQSPSDISYNEMNKYIKNEMFYAIFPSISKSGKSTNYWENTNLYERDRSLFAKNIPIIKEISKAGWEPIPYAEIDNHNLKIERYGDSSNIIYYTIRNDLQVSQTGTLTIDISKLGININEINKILITELTSGITAEMSPNKQLNLFTEINPDETLVYKLIFI